jgi:predicted O-linked N-acetylglucosamine transferase (SPINDLY family)
VLSLPIFILTVFILNCVDYMIKNQTSSNNIIGWQQQVDTYLKDGSYAKAANLYEQAIKTSPDRKDYYWKLGLVFLLKGKEEEAQTTWLLGMVDGDAEQIEVWSQQLKQVLITEANQRAASEDYLTAWSIRQHIREILPDDINNLFQLLDLSITINSYTSELLAEYGLIQKFSNDEVDNVDEALLLHLLKKILICDPKNQLSTNFASLAIKHIRDKNAILQALIPPIYQIAYSFAELPLAREYTEMLLRIMPENQEVLRTMAHFCVELTESELAVKYAEKSYSLSKNLHEQIIDYHLVCKAKIDALGCNSEVKKNLEFLESLIRTLIEEYPDNLGNPASRLYNSIFFFPYSRDSLEKNLTLRNQVAQLCQVNIEKAVGERLDGYRQKHIVKKSLSKKTLRIGYLSHCFRRHSVGWIARWLFAHHDRDKLEIYGYLQGAEHREDPLQNWYVRHFTKATTYGIAAREIVEDIQKDDIDILIDLDSTTLVNNCSIMAVKSAPVQATWLGWDASGIPTIDYFIADPYVLPENAGDYYSEKIWRLPQTYVAVNGFEQNLPNLRRDNLGIPSDAVVYFTAQRGYKYNEDTARLQMKILKEVPNSYFLFKKFGEAEVISELLMEIARSEGVSSDRLIAIPQVGLEEIHRANLAIADVVLDTYPYNGATTTLETLWMCIPIVTKVGQQFAARNSYTMMVNAGITEGIAWNDNEYVEWGIRLGRDESLRKQVSWKLRQSKRTAPLWNAKQFTRDMEEAYQQMWQIYTETQ